MDGWQLDFSIQQKWSSVPFTSNNCKLHVNNKWSWHNKIASAESQLLNELVDRVFRTTNCLYIVYCNEDTTWSHLTQAQSLVISYFVEGIFIHNLFFFCFFCRVFSFELPWTGFGYSQNNIYFVQSVCIICICYFLEFLFVNFWNLFIFFLKWNVFAWQNVRSTCNVCFNFHLHSTRDFVSHVSWSECIGFWFDQCIIWIQKCWTLYRTPNLFSTYKIGEFSRNFHLKCRAISPTIYFNVFQ